MRDKDLIIQERIYFFGYSIESRGIFYHFIGDPGHGLDMPGNRLAGIYQGFKDLYNFIAIEDMNTDLCDPIGGSVGSRGFNIYNGIHKMNNPPSIKSGLVKVGEANFVKISQR